MSVIIPEKNINNQSDIVSHNKMKEITFQMEQYICKIYKLDGATGTGFFCKIPFGNDLLSVLITNNHVISIDDIEKNNNSIAISINNNNNEIKKKI